MTSSLTLTGSPRDRAHDDSDLRALTVVSRAVATPQPLSSTLSTIAEAAADLLECESAVILLRDGRHRLRFAGGHGVSASYREHFDADQSDMPVSEALQLRHPVQIEDTETAVRFAPFRHIAHEEGFRAMLALPLTLSDSAIGTLAVYRRKPGAWSPEALGFLELVGAYVASAVRTAQLIDGQSHRLQAHARVVQGLRGQTQDHLDRLADIRASLDSGDPQRTSRLVAHVETELSETYAEVVRRIHDRVVASMLLGEASMARQKGVQFRLDRRSRLAALSGRLGEVEAVSVVSNLLENAFDSVAGLPAARRRVTLLIRANPRQLVIRVRDWGVGLGGLGDERAIEHGVSTKHGHSGVGLAIVASLVDGAGGCLSIERLAVGTAFKVVIPQ